MIDGINSIYDYIFEGNSSLKGAYLIALGMWCGILISIGRGYLKRKNSSEDNVLVGWKMKCKHYWIIFNVLVAPISILLFVFVKNGMAFFSS